jgi:mRNA interferase MazF
MPSTTGYSFGDVVLVPFPFTDQSTSKKRPAVVVSSDAYHRRRRDVIVMAVTSQPAMSADSPDEVVLTSWKDAGLLKPSVVKPVVATLERSLIVKKLGALRAPDVEALRDAIGRVFG